MRQLKKGMILIKYVLIALLAVFISNILGTGKTSSAGMEEVAQKVTQAMDMEELSLADNRMVKRLYGINANDYDSTALYVSDSNMKVEELLIVKLKDASQAETVTDAVQSRLDRQLASFEGYGPEQCSLLNAHVLDADGNYVLFVVHQDAKAADQAFQEAL